MRADSFLIEFVLFQDPRDWATSHWFHWCLIGHLLTVRARQVSQERTKNWVYFYVSSQCHAVITPENLASETSTCDSPWILYLEVARSADPGSSIWRLLSRRILDPLSGGGSLGGSWILHLEVAHSADPGSSAYRGWKGRIRAKMNLL